MPKLLKNFNSSSSCPLNCSSSGTSRLILIAVGHDSWIFFDDSRLASPSYAAEYNQPPNRSIRRRALSYVLYHRHPINAELVKLNQPLAKLCTDRPPANAEIDFDHRWVNEWQRTWLYGSCFCLVEVITEICIVRQIFEYLHREAVQLCLLWFAYYWFRIEIRYTPWKCYNLILNSTGK